jgi:hypothetical protein
VSQIENAQPQTLWSRTYRADTFSHHVFGVQPIEFDFEFEVQQAVEDVLRRLALEGWLIRSEDHEESEQNHIILQVSEYILEQESQ